SWDADHITGDHSAHRERELKVPALLGVKEAISANSITPSSKVRHCIFKLTRSVPSPLRERVRVRGISTI
ncbi:hypothetical protein, partial [Serratia fonticola]|uniref:hypothetical protein n=1 Tax=Serratia fonticola TaxID=47917 RepID=UPI001C0EDF57